MRSSTFAGPRPSPRIRARFSPALRAFSPWLGTENLLDIDLPAKLAYSRVDRRMTLVSTDEELLAPLKASVRLASHHITHRLAGLAAKERLLTPDPRHMKAAPALPDRGSE